MKVILLADVKGVGKKDQIINASEGYANNFLLPRKLAVEANAGNVKKLDNEKKAVETQRQEELEAARELCTKLEAETVVIKVKLGSNGKLFGSVTNKEIGAALKSQSTLDIDKKKIVVKEPIKDTGEHEVSVKLHPKVTAKLKVVIEAQ
jgi:large subunit ribosomal protein L9